MKPQRLGNVSIPDEELIKDKKECKKIGPCGIGKKAVYLSSFYIDRRYYIPISSVKRIFKRIAMSKGGFTGKGVFGTLSYLVVVYEDGKEKQCNFKHEEDVDRFVAYIEEKYPDIPVHSLEAERKPAEKERWLEEKQRKRNISEETKRCLAKLEQAEEYLKKQSDIYMDLSQSAKKKRTYDRSNPAYKWVALAIVLMGGAAFVYGIYALTTHAGFGMYFLLFGLAAIFLFAGANVFPTSKNNKNYIEKQSDGIDQSDGRVYQSVSGFSGTGSLCTSDCVKENAGDYERRACEKYSGSIAGFEKRFESVEFQRSRRERRV
ncbi:MAG: ATPase P [[Clostridium] symbiosum]